MRFDDFLQSLSSPALRAIAAHWNDARGAQLMPSWNDLRPAQIAGHLKLIWAFRYDAKTREFTGRLAGERIARGFGRSFRGLRLDELHTPQSLPLMQSSMERLLREPALYHLNGVLFRQRERVATGERIMLPLSDDGIRGDGVLGASVVSFPFADPDYGPVEMASEGAEWFALSRLAAVA